MFETRERDSERVWFLNISIRIHPYCLLTIGRLCRFRTAGIIKCKLHWTTKCTHFPFALPPSSTIPPPLAPSAISWQVAFGVADLKDSSGKTGSCTGSCTETSPSSLCSTPANWLSSPGLLCWRPAAGISAAFGWSWVTLLGLAFRTVGTWGLVAGWACCCGSWGLGFQGLYTGAIGILPCKMSLLRAWRGFMGKG